MLGFNNTWKWPWICNMAIWIYNMSTWVIISHCHKFNPYLQVRNSFTVLRRTWKCNEACNTCTWVLISQCLTAASRGHGYLKLLGGACGNETLVTVKPPHPVPSQLFMFSLSVKICSLFSFQINLQFLNFFIDFIVCYHYMPMYTHLDTQVHTHTHSVYIHRYTVTYRHTQISFWVSKYFSFIVKL